jgi:hypothetical protein
VSGVNYHAWTHAPKADGGTDPLEPLRWARAEKSYASTVQSIPNNSLTEVVWDNYWNTTTDGTFRADPSNLDIIVRAPGVYIVKAFIVWAVTTVGVFRVGISKGIGTVDWLANGDASLFGGTLEFSRTTLFHFAGQEELSLVLHQSSGAARNLDAGFLHVVRIGAYDGEIWENMNPDHA